MIDALNLQIETINTLMGSLLSLFNAIIVTQYFTDIVWVVLLIGVTAAMALTIVHRISRSFDPVLLFLMLLISCLFMYALYQRSLSTPFPISTEIFWPAAPVLIYVVWVIMLEIVLAGKI